MTPTIPTTLGPQAQGRPSRGFDPATGADQAFGSLLDDIAQGGATSAGLSQADTSQASAAQPDAEAAAAGSPSEMPSMVLSTIMMSSASASAKQNVPAQDVQSLLARLGLSGPPATAAAAGPVDAATGEAKTTPAARLGTGLAATMDQPAAAQVSDDPATAAAPVARSTPSTAATGTIAITPAVGKPGPGELAARASMPADVPAGSVQPSTSPLRAASVPPGVVAAANAKPNALPRADAAAPRPQASGLSASQAGNGGARAMAPAASVAVTTPRAAVDKTAETAETREAETPSTDGDPAAAVASAASAVGPLIAAAALAPDAGTPPGDPGEAVAASGIAEPATRPGRATRLAPAAAAAPASNRDEPQAIDDDLVAASGTSVDATTGAGSTAMSFAFQPSQSVAAGIPSAAGNVQVAAPLAEAMVPPRQAARHARAGDAPASATTSVSAHAEAPDINPAAALPAVGDLEPATDATVTIVNVNETRTHLAPPRAIPSSLAAVPDGGPSRTTTPEVKASTGAAETSAGASATGPGDSTRPDAEPAPASAAVPPSATHMAPLGATAVATVRAISHAVASLTSQVADAAPAAATPRVDGTTPSPSSMLAPARSMTLQLAPADLGRVTVHLALRDGALDVHLAVDDQKTLGLVSHARDALAAAIGDGAAPLNSLVIRGADTASAQTAGSHDQAYSNRGSAYDDTGAGGAGGRGSQGDDGMQRPARDTPARDPRADDARGADGLFV